MILNANIPLKNQQPTRQRSWRVGLFLGLIALGLFLGWGIAKRMFIGITTPLLETPSGVSMRITPENALWLTKHTGGLALNASCPIDLPKLLSLKRPSWIILGDSGETMHITFEGDLSHVLENYKTSFACDTNPLQTTTIFPLFTPDAWAWANNATLSVTLSKQGLSIDIPGISEKESLWIPKQTLSSALPLQKTDFENFPRTWQGLNDLFSSEKGIAFFSWTNEKPETAIAITIKGDMDDETMRSLFYDIANIPTEIQKQLRKDEVSYITTSKEEIFVKWENEYQAVIHLKNETIIGYVTKQEDATLLSTSQTEWINGKIHWEAPLQNQQNAITHHARTLAHFGTKIFATNKKLTITNENL